MKILLILVLIYVGYVVFRVIRNASRQVDNFRRQAEQFREQQENSMRTRSGHSKHEKDITSRSRIIEETGEDGR